MNYGNGKYDILLIGPKKFIKNNDNLIKPDIIKTELWIDNIIEPIIIEKNNIEFSNMSNHAEHNPNNLFYINYKFESLSNDKSSDQNIKGVIFIKDIPNISVNNYIIEIILDNPVFAQTCSHIHRNAYYNHTKQNIYLDKCFYADLINLPTYQKLIFKIHLTDNGLTKFQNYINKTY